VLVLSATINIFGYLDGFIPLATQLIAATPLPLVLAVVNLGVLAFLMGHLLMSSFQPAALQGARVAQGAPGSRHGAISDSPSLE
jgi:hypothetical protein